MGGKNIYQFGIRSGSKEEFAVRDARMQFPSRSRYWSRWSRSSRACKGRPVYVTIDIDVLDPSAAPGTGTAEAGGITSKELWQRFMPSPVPMCNVVGCDLVEVAPVYDPTEQTPDRSGQADPRDAARIREGMSRRLTMAHRISVRIKLVSTWDDERIEQDYRGELYTERDQLYM